MCNRLSQFCIKRSLKVNTISISFYHLYKNNVCRNSLLQTKEDGYINYRIFYSIHCLVIYTFTLCKSGVLIIEPWKNLTVVKCRLKRPSSSRSGGFLKSKGLIKMDKKMWKAFTIEFISYRMWNVSCFHLVVLIHNKLGWRS